MSYILDALRRAEADRERERGRVPGLHTPAVGGAAPAAGPRRWLPWAGGGLLLLAGIGAGSWWAGTPLPAVPEPPVGARPAADIVATPAAPAASAPPAVPAPAPQPEAGPASAPAASPYLPPVPPPAAVVAAPVAPPTRAPVPVPPTTAAPPAAAEARIPRLAELPESLRRELPRLAVSGSVYSDDPASRFVMINGEVVREGARLGADLVLEQIGPRELVLRFKGQRYRQPV